MAKQRSSKIHLPRRKSILTDPRLLTGIALILISVLATTWIVQRARGGEELYRLTQPIAQGQPIPSSALEVVKARTGTSAYLPVGKLPREAVAVRSLDAGELLPTSAVASTAEQSRRQVVINVGTRIPTSVQVGSSVEIWSINKSERAPQDATSTVVCQDAIILTLKANESGLGAQRQNSVEISVPAADLEKVISTSGSGATLVIVPRG